MWSFIQKDKSNDQVYIGVSRAALERGKTKKTIRATEDIALDFDARGRLLGLDIGRASRVLGKEAFAEEHPRGDLVGVAEAARLCGVRRPNFIRDFADRPGFPKPVAELASGRIWLRSEVLSFLSKPGNNPSGSPEAGGSHTYQALLGVLTNDELAFRHSALTYFRNRFLRGGIPRPPTIEELTIKSMEEDRDTIAKAQAWNVELYVEAAWRLIEKYSPALKSYLSAVVPPRTVTPDEVFKRIWVEALQRIQRNEYSPASNVSFSGWLLSIAVDALARYGIEIPMSPGQDPLSENPLERMVQAATLRKAMRDRERVLEHRQAERFVLEYLSHLRTDEIITSVPVRRQEPVEDIEEARRLLEERLMELLTTKRT